MNTINYKIEQGIVNYLTKKGKFKGCAITAYSDSSEAPQEHPSIIVTCQNVSQDDDMPREAKAKQANVTCLLTGESEDITWGKFDALADKLESMTADLVEMKKIFNAPTCGRDYRKVQGLHLHNIEEFQTDADTDGTQWEFGVGFTLILQGE